MVRALDISELLNEIIRNVTGHIGCDAASVLLWNNAQKHIDQAAATNIQSDKLLGQIRQQGGITRWVVDHRESLLVNRLVESPVELNDLLQEQNIQSFLAVPIQYRTDMLGVIYALSTTPESFTEQHLDQMKSLSNLSGLAIYNAIKVNRIQELNNFKDAMLGLAAHDLRNPLSRFVGYFDVLVDDLSPLNEEQLEWVDRMRYAVSQMEDLIEGILHYTNITHRSEGASFEENNLNDLVQEVSQDFATDASKKAQSIEEVLWPKPLMMSMDALLLKEALANLMSNAIKYADEETQIQIVTEAINGEYRIYVKDQGPGIPADHQEEVFQPFTRLPAAKIHRGSGLGLSLVKTIIEQHGGYISLDSEEGTGSVFTLHFPGQDV